jgi:hypothetical protein
VGDVREQFDVVSVEIRGFARATGATPEGVPASLVFRRR